MARVSPFTDQSKSMTSSLQVQESAVSLSARGETTPHLIFCEYCRPEANSDDLESQMESSYSAPLSVTVGEAVSSVSHLFSK